MSWLRRSILLVALASFAAGVGLGLAIPTATANWSEAGPDDPHREFIQRFADTYNLTDQQVRSLRTVLLACDDDLLKIARGFDLQEWPREERSRLVQASRRMQTRVEYLLDKEQRARYRKDMGTNKDH